MPHVQHWTMMKYLSKMNIEKLRLIEFQINSRYHHECNIISFSLFFYVNLETQLQASRPHAVCVCVYVCVCRRDKNQDNNYNNNNGTYHRKCSQHIYSIIQRQCELARHVVLSSVVAVVSVAATAADVRSLYHFYSLSPAPKTICYCSVLQHI